MNRPSTSHAPSRRAGACEPCRHGDHGTCLSNSNHHDSLDPGDPGDCTCYDDRWEWHEANRAREPQ